MPASVSITNQPPTDGPSDPGIFLRQTNGGLTAGRSTKITSIFVIFIFTPKVPELADSDK